LSLGLVRSYFADEHVGPGSKETRIGICKNDKMPVMVKQSKFFSNPFEPQSPRSTPNFSESSETTSDSGMNLANHFLIAMPSMLDPIFGGAVVYLCEHNANGALGVIINKPTDMTLDVLFERIDLKLEIQAVRNASVNKLVMFGGPVQVERGFVLHAPPGEFTSTMRVSEDVALTTSKEVLEAATVGNGPERMLVALGCAGWGAGQLEQEIVKNGWLTVQADPALIFDAPIETRFAAAIKLLGIDPMMLAGDAGHA